MKKANKRGDLSRRLRRLRLGAFGERDRLDVGGALRDRLERLALIAGRRRNPECVDGIGKQQNFDAARAKPFELRARGEALGVIAGLVEDRRLIFLQRADIIGERAAAIGMALK